MRLGDMLVSANLVSQADIDRALAAQSQTGARLGDALVALGAITHAALENFTNQIPPEPETLAATGISPTDLMSLLIKQIHMFRLESVADLIAAIKLPPRLVEALIHTATTRKLLAALGGIGTAMRYELSEEGRRWAIESLKTSLYTGPAPVTLDEFCRRIDRQKITNEHVTPHALKSAFAGYTVTDEFLHLLGPALNAGRAMLLYGPPGNGKTTIARRFADIFSGVIYVPHAVMIEGQIMRVFDASFHIPISAPGAALREPASLFSTLRRDSHDARWVAIRRPFIVAGGELTLDMLDLAYDPATGFYEAPLHIKAQGGCFVIDDFGRQLVAPTTLLNRWIVPMESRVDYLKLHTGKSFSIPFEALLVFSTNIEPEDLMDPAFLRRLPYKIEIAAPSRKTYFGIFQSLCARHGIPFNEAIFETLVKKVTIDHGLALANFHAAFILDQVIAIARFTGTPPILNEATMDYALKNLKVRAKA